MQACPELLEPRTLMREGDDAQPAQEDDEGRLDQEQHEPQHSPEKSKPSLRAAVMFAVPVCAG